MDFFKRMFGLMRSMLILYVHEHDHLGFGMLTVKRAVIRKQKCKLLRTLLVSRNQGEILRSVAWNFFTMNEQTIGNRYLDLSFLSSIIFLKNILS